MSVPVLDGGVDGLTDVLDTDDCVIVLDTVIVVDGTMIPIYNDNQSISIHQ